MSRFDIIIDVLGLLVVSSAIYTALVVLPLRSRKAALQSYIAMARAVETREPHLLGQSEQTARYVKLMAWLSCSLTPRKIMDLETSALLHTIGKVAVSYSLLNLPQSLCSVGEIYDVREYVRVGAAMLGAVPMLKSSAEAVLYHREYLDGSGYPFGRHGNAIPLTARMLCVATEFVALTSPRIYRAGLAALTPDEAQRHLRRYAGTRYDRRCVVLLGMSVAILNGWKSIRSYPAPFPVRKAMRHAL